MSDAASWEYTLVWGLMVFFFIETLLFSLIGQSQAFVYEEEEIGLIDGFGYLFANPYTDSWTKLIYGGFVVVPLFVIGSMIALNYARGR